jgi:maltooligosyltrehalose trehalohydrolase
VFRRCKIDWNERERNAAMLAMHRDLLRIRRENPPFPAHDAVNAVTMDGAVLAERCFVLRSIRGPVGNQRPGDQLLIVNLGDEFRLEPVKEPLLAPESGSDWHVAWSSESPQYGGSAAPVWDVHEKDGSWRIPTRCTLLFHTTKRSRMNTP